MICPWQRGAPASSLFLVRVSIQAIAIFATCHAYRPDADGKQLEVMPRGVTHNATRPSKPSSLEQSSAKNSTILVGNPVKEKSKPLEGNEKCSGKGDGWVCAAAFKDGSDVKSGDHCKVKCLDPYNTHPKVPKVRCDNGKYDEEPECIENVQCDGSGGGWACKDIKEGVKLNEGMICHMECAEPDFKKSADKATCKQGKYEPELSCVQAKHCEAKGDEGPAGWECKGEMDGREKIQSGHPCQVTCKDPKLVPHAASVTCNDGKYSEQPSCGEKPPPATKNVASPRSTCAPLTVLFMAALCKFELFT